MKCKCPYCGGVFDTDTPHIPGLSVSAMLVLTFAPERWLRGTPVGIRALAQRAHVGYGVAREALLEMTRTGYVMTIPYGKQGRQRYAGNPDALLRGESWRVLSQVRTTRKVKYHSV